MTKNQHQMIYAGSLVSWDDYGDKQYGILVDFYAVGNGAICGLILDEDSQVFTYMDATEITLVEAGDGDES